MYSTRDHTAIPLPDSATSKSKSFSLPRTWKRATRCQKNLVVLVLCLTVISIFVYSSQISKLEKEEAEGLDFVRKKKDKKKWTNAREIPDEQIGGNENRLPQLGDEQKQAIKDLENKIRLDIRKKPPVLKHGPPFRGGQHKGPSDENVMVAVDLDIAPDPPQNNKVGSKEKNVDHNIRANEYQEAREFVANKLTFDKDIDVNLFECTIRVLGSMLSMYHLTNDKLYLDKAVDIGDRLLPALTKSPSPVPYSDVNLRTGNARAPKWGPDSSVSEVTTIQLEFRDLSFITGDSKYKDAVDRVSKHVHDLAGKKDGLIPMWINARTGNFRPSSTLTVGARADSYYEYLIKLWVQTGGTESVYLDDYLEAVRGIEKHLIGLSIPNHFTYVGELLNGVNPSAKMDHLVCFLGGSLALGSRLLEKKLPEVSKRHMDLGAAITKTCHEMYASTPTGLSPEITYFNLNQAVKEDVIVKPLDRHNLLRPETIESYFYLWRLTNSSMYRDWGWNAAQAFEKYCKVEGGYTSIKNVMDLRNTKPMDKMESFFLGETLKYLYLLFSDDHKLLPLDKWVFNTEAHPLPIRSSSRI